MNCDVPTSDHAEQVRPYACGNRCNRHAPWAAAGRPEPRTTGSPAESKSAGPEPKENTR